MEVPLLSQDEFFRHLNLRSVHATAAKYHYRQALKKRLRASTILSSEAQQKLINSHLSTKCKPSPVKWLSPKASCKIFGKPRVLQEAKKKKKKRRLDFDTTDKSVNGSIIESLLVNSNLLKHPRIRREVEDRVTPVTSCIRDRKCYYNNNNSGGESENKDTNLHVISYRIQPKSEDVEAKNRDERKMSAGLALYHYYKPKTINGAHLSFREFKDLFVQKGPTLVRIQPPKKAVRPAVVEQPKPAAAPPMPILKTAFGRHVKPVLAPVNNKACSAANTPAQPRGHKCLECDKMFATGSELAAHTKAIHILGSEQQLHNSFSMIKQAAKKPAVHCCDICHRKYDKRSRMIRHIKRCHPFDMHKVDLNKFAYKKVSLVAEIES